MDCASDRACHNCFRVLGERTRVLLLGKIAEQPRNVAELTEYAALRQPTVSHHLKQLESIGMIKKTKKGRETYYAFNEKYPCKGCGVFSAGIKS